MIKRIPIHQTSNIPSFGSPVQMLEYEVRQRNFMIDESYREPDTRRLAVWIAEAYKEDINEHTHDSDVSYVHKPARLRDAIILRFFGESFTSIETMPSWLPEWLKKKLLVRNEKIALTTHNRTTLIVNRICPHQGADGHANFMFGADLTYLDEDFQKSLRKKAKEDRAKSILDRIHSLIREFRKAGGEPSLISLGHSEHALFSGGYIHTREEMSHYWGAKVEFVNRKTYLSIQ